MESNKKVYFFTKRLFDIIFSLIGIVFILPLALLIKISYLIKKDTTSIFFTQKRIGKNGKEFNFYKFRSMIKDADKVLEKILEENEELRKEWNEYHKLENDPRITKVGKFIRKTSLDEFPQFINVLRGDMSLIGPRPLVPGELEEHNGDAKIYNSIKPGVSGWWAANGRSSVSYEDRLELEYYYCKNCNWLLDIKCIFRTIKIVIMKKGVA